MRQLVVAVLLVALVGSASSQNASSPEAQHHIGLLHKFSRIGKKHNTDKVTGARILLWRRPIATSLRAAATVIGGAGRLAPLKSKTPNLALHDSARAFSAHSDESRVPRSLCTSSARINRSGTSILTSSEDHHYDYLYDTMLPRYLRQPKVKLLEIGLGCDMHYGEGHSVPGARPRDGISRELSLLLPTEEPLSEEQPSSLHRTPLPPGGVTPQPHPSPPRPRLSVAGVLPGCRARPLDGRVRRHVRPEVGAGPPDGRQGAPRRPG